MIVLVIRTLVLSTAENVTAATASIPDPYMPLIKEIVASCAQETRLNTVELGTG